MIIDSKIPSHSGNGSLDSIVPSSSNKAKPNKLITKNSKLPALPLTENNRFHQKIISRLLTNVRAIAA